MKMRYGHNELAIVQKDPNSHLPICSNTNHPIFQKPTKTCCPNSNCLSTNQEECLTPFDKSAPMISPTKMIRRKTVALKFCIDTVTAKILGERIKTDLSININNKKIKLKEALLTGIDKTYEPYHILAGKYSIEYTKKNAPKDAVGQTSNQTVSHTKNFHHSSEGNFILDGNFEEVNPRLLPYVPPQKKNLDKSFKMEKNYSNIKISSKEEIAFLRSKLGNRPSDVGKIVNEIFEIDESSTVFCPIYQLTFKDKITEKEVFVKIDGITGERIPKELNKTIIEDEISNSIECQENEDLPQIKSEPFESKSENPNLEFINSVFVKNYESAVKPNTLEGILKSLPKSVEVFNVGDDVIAVVGDLSIPEDSTLNKTLVVKGHLRICSGCQIMGRLKGLVDIVIGSNTKINGNVISGGPIVIGSNSWIHGSLESDGPIELKKNVVIEGNIFSRAIVSLSESNSISGSINAKKVTCLEKGSANE